MSSKPALDPACCPADPGDAAEAAYRGVAEAVARIDLRTHSGVHPRIGAADVVPFVPLAGVSLEDCAAPHEGE